MARKGKSTEEIIGFLREAEVRISQGETVGKICRSIGVAEPCDHDLDGQGMRARSTPSGSRRKAGQTYEAYDAPMVRPLVAAVDEVCRYIDVDDQL